MEKNKLIIFQKGFNYSQDGPGNRLVYHLVGCNMKCPWCSNPEGMDIRNLRQDQFHTMSIEEVYNDILSCKRLFFDNGGVTFTGGECTLQLKSLIHLFPMLNEAKINIAIETNGTSLKLKELLHFIKYLIIDFKHYDNQKHLNITGQSNKTIKKNIEYALKNKNKLLVRIPLVNGYNASSNDIIGFLEYFKTINCSNLSVEFLKYHEYGKEKWKKIKRAYTVQDGFISDDVYKLFVSEFMKSDIKVINT
ncbi:MAG: radical SAM protein [Bacilli bacterium]|nr:radical SAM protein [Bacilli bacterium]